ncbi:hypothetical protein L195_g042880 [Trifolium pratense]|uniref:Uncharacterized protein n=1 Tax=Trifolium pratense TaxID=57577 RepID=A0A2K3M7P5_TRIPR|nr:hypothetical protein L195_g042880 [Trifolium pratense]
MGWMLVKSPRLEAGNSRISTELLGADQVQGLIIIKKLEACGHVLVVSTLMDTYFKLACLDFALEVFKKWKFIGEFKVVNAHYQFSGNIIIVPPYIHKEGVSNIERRLIIRKLAKETMRKGKTTFSLYSSIWIIQWDPEEFNIPMLVITHECGWKGFPLLYSLLDFVYNRGKLCELLSDDRNHKLEVITQSWQIFMQCLFFRFMSETQIYPHHRNCNKEIEKDLWSSKILVQMGLQLQLCEQASSKWVLKKTTVSSNSRKESRTANEVC